MVKVITYGSYDMLHYGHLRLLQRAKALGDYLIVGITSDDFDKKRGKINLQQSLTERIEAVRATGLADQIIIEEYEGQKIDDIKRYGVDIFTVGSDWKGHFDYLNEYCEVIYLERTEGISSSELRASERKVRIGFIGSNESRVLNKYCAECKYVNGAEVACICTTDSEVMECHGDVPIADDYPALLKMCDAVYILSHPKDHYAHIKAALEAHKHVLVELPIVIEKEQFHELYTLAAENHVLLMPAMKTAYATAYNRLLLLIKGGIIGKIVSVDACCTSLRDPESENRNYSDVWNSICAWGPTAMLPVFQILGTVFKQSSISSWMLDDENKYDAFTRIDFLFDSAVASVKVGRGVKSEGSLVVSGTKGYIYVPAPWWKTDYFEVRFENHDNNQRFFYQLIGEGIRYELVAFIKSIQNGGHDYYISDDVSEAICGVISDFYHGNRNILT